MPRSEKPLRIACCCLLAALAALPVPAQETAPSLADLGWLAGSWRSGEGGRVAEEFWMPPAGGMMVGVHRDLVGAGKAFFEYLRIEQTEEGIVYFASPRGRTPTPFALLELGERKVVFQNLEHDFPQRILYWLDGEGLLHARIEGEVEGEPRGSEWIWQRTD